MTLSKRRTVLYLNCNRYRAIRLPVIVHWER
jgi:hypothetical protein